jgi:anti-anti-sigma regulatory factor
MPVTIETSSNQPGSVVIKIAGDMTVPYASEIRDRLIAAFDQSDTITVDLSKVAGIDVSGLQLLCSAHRSSIQLKKVYKIIGRGIDMLWEAADMSGQLRQKGCAPDIGGTCIWTGGRES